MGRKKAPRCNRDCFNCIYDDCIETETSTVILPYGEKKKPGRPKLPEGMVKAHQREYAKRHYQEIKEKRSAYYKEYYQKNKGRIQRQQKEYRERRNKGI